MTVQAYAQIRWHQDRLGLLLVNHERQKFFLHADKLLELRRGTDYYPVIKFRDRNPSRAIAYHGGEIRGNLSEEGERAILTLYLFPLYQDCRDDPFQGVPSGFMAIQTYNIPTKELNAHLNAIHIMTAQRQQFDDLLRAAEATPITTNVRKLPK